MPTNTSAVILRDVIPSDFPLLLEWIPTERDLLLFSGRSVPWPPDAAQFERRAAQPDVRAWTALAVAESYAPFGHIELVSVSDTQARIAQVLIAPAFRGRGLARPLMQAVMDLVRDEGAVRELGLYVVPGNAIAVHTYERLGFVAAEPRPEHPEFEYMSLSL